MVTQYEVLRPDLSQAELVRYIHDNKETAERLATIHKNNHGNVSVILAQTDWEWDAETARMRMIDFRVIAEY